MTAVPKMKMKVYPYVEKVVVADFIRHRFDCLSNVSLHQLEKTRLDAVPPSASKNGLEAICCLSSAVASM
ncbi:MAG: hypothetical protein JRI56_07400 [Deltaproteobacteria bacterium]|nr:hypothetical protein [Deltaproteobacteria bacterium]